MNHTMERLAVVLCEFKLLIKYLSLKISVQISKIQYLFMILIEGQQVLMRIFDMENLLWS